MDFSHMYSKHHYLLWNWMVEHFGPSAHHETLESFFKQNFLFCFSLGRNPRLGENYVMRKDPADRQMSFVEAGTLEVEFFVSPLVCPYVFHGKGVWDEVAPMWDAPINPSVTIL